MYTLKKTIQVPASLETVFDFFKRPENLEKLTPSFLKFSILTPPPLAMGNGAVFDYRIRLLGLPMRWTSIINHYDPPHGFVDIQLKGPYTFWYHRHRFTPKDGGVEVTDEVHYDIGFSFLGGILHELIIRHQLRMIFAHRMKILRELFP